MQLLISVEPDTRRVPNLPPPAPRSSRSYLCSPSPSPTPSNALRPTRPPAGAPLAALYRRATLCPFRGGGWRRVTSLSKNGRCRLSLSRSASLSCAPSPSFHLLPAPPASSPLFFSLLLSLRFLPFFSRCFSFSPFLSAGSASPFLHLQLSSVISLPRAYLSLRSSRSRGCTREKKLLSSRSRPLRGSVGPLTSPRLSLQCLPLWLAHLPCRGVALIGVSTTEGAGRGRGG